MAAGAAAHVGDYGGGVASVLRVAWSNGASMGFAIFAVLTVRLSHIVLWDKCGIFVR